MKKLPTSLPPCWRTLLSLAAAAALSACATAPMPGGPVTPEDVAAAPPVTPAVAPDVVVMPLPSESAPAPVAAPVDPLRPDESVDLNANSARIDLWSRVRSGFTVPDLDNDHVRRAEQWYSSRPDYVQRMTERGGRYLYHIVEEVQRRGLPTELALLPFIESAFNPQAMSTAKASGMWQFMPATGRDFELRQNIFRDDRRDVLASTRAALDYLTRLYGMFNDWHLALAAYNWGEGNVQRAVARNAKAGLPTDYESLRMPDETRYYVPKLQAVKNIVMRPDNFALSLPPLENHPYFLGVPIQRDIDVALAARLAGLTLDEFKALNPQMNQPVILAAGTPQVLLPYDNASIFLNNLSRHRGQLASWTAWVAPRTMRPADVAKELDISEADLREANRIPLRMLVKAGSTLIVPRTEDRAHDVAGHIAENASIALAPDVPPLQRVVVKAGRKGETVAAVARRTHTTVAQLAAWNKVSAKGRFAPGSSVVMYLPERAAQVAMASVAPEPEPAAKPAAVARNAKAAPTRSAARPATSTGRTTVASARPAARQAPPARSAARAAAPAPRTAVASRGNGSMRVAEARDSVRR
ncbi:transglycosylase SLT domain-containing protein [Azohydromonas australica]|uniref:transglycosylase SLT domain-containing protein n=1 Tax=Azohydromonas australica TaxID=364039 RepID=UPI00068900CF|nr:transglycosylase SLT domain-containing protein [Azohydromonas australica]